MLSFVDIGPRNKITRSLNNESLRNAIDKNRAVHAVKKDDDSL